MKKITIKQLGAELKLSPSTISRALSDDYQISAKTKALVLSHAKKRNYSANLYAKSLREGRTRTIGLIVCSLVNDLMNQVLEGMYDYWYEKGYQLLVFQSKGDNETERNCISRLVDIGIDGLMISPIFDSSNTNYLNKLIADGLPIVVFDRINTQIRTVQVAVDNFLCGHMAANHLIANECTEVLILGGVGVPLSHERIKGFTSAMANRGFTTSRSAYVNVNCKEALHRELTSLFKQRIISDKSVRAVFASTDLLTIAVIRGLKEMMVDVPVVGFCNSELSDIFYAQPVCIVQPSYELGKLTSHNLFRLLQNGGISEMEIIYLPAKLVENVTVNN